MTDLEPVAEVKTADLSADPDRVQDLARLLAEILEVADMWAWETAAATGMRRSQRVSWVPASLAELYGSLLQPPAATRLVRTIHAVATAPVLVHRTAGKDRTGTVIAVVLRLVGVEPVAIAADYAATESVVPLVRAHAGSFRGFDEVEKAGLPAGVAAGLMGASGPWGLSG